MVVMAKTNKFLELIDQEVGPPEPLPLDKLARIGEEAALDKQIVELARAGVPYSEMAELLEMTMGQLLNRISRMVNTQSDMMSQEMINDYLLIQLQLINMGISNSLEDMAKEYEGDLEWDDLVMKARDKGRMGLHKFLQHQAAIMQLFKQKVEVDVRQVQISVVRGEDFDAL